MNPMRMIELKEVLEIIKNQERTESIKYAIRIIDSFSRDFDELLGKHEKIMQIVDECKECNGTGYEPTRCCSGKDCTCGGELILSDRECRECDGIGSKVSK